MDNKSLPKVSLLIAMRNESKRIGACIESILKQDYPADKIEILVMDGKSTDDSWNIVEHLLAGRAEHKLLSNPAMYQSHGWNLGIVNSSGAIIGIVSAHSLLETDYVSKAVETLARTGVDMVGGPMTAVGTGYISTAISIATSSPFGVGGARFHYASQEEEMDTVYMGLCHRSVYERIGGFDEEMIRNQDDELSYRLRKADGRIVCNPQIRSHYYNRASLSSFWKQYFQYGWYKVRVLQKHPRQMRSRQFIPPAFVLALIVSGLITLTPILRSLSFVVPLLYLLINLLASLYTASMRGWKYLFILPVVFVILHLSYGLGFLGGLFRFWDRWERGS